MKRLSHLTILALTSVMLAVTFEGGHSHSDSKLSRDLEQRIKQSGSRSLRVIIQTKGRPDTSELLAIYNCGGYLRQVYNRLNACAAVLPADKIALICEYSNVKRISLDRPVRVSTGYSVPATRTDVAWQTYNVNGSGIGVAVIDSGIQSRPDIQSRIVGWKDILNPANTTPVDGNGHGTHVAGIVAGDSTSAIQGGYSMNFYGVGRGANLIGVRVLDDQGNGYVSDVIAGIDWCIDNKELHNIRVMNLSLGHAVSESYLTDPLCQAVERAWNADIVVVVAAGNRGRSVQSDPNSAPAYGRIESPGNDPYVITVGATNTRGTLGTEDDVMASYSSHGPSIYDYAIKPDLVAPGNRLISLIRPGGVLHTNNPQLEVSPGSYGGTGSVEYFRLSGTSMSAGAVSGAVALMLHYNSSLSPNTVKLRLMMSANRTVTNPDSSAAGILFRGAGLLDVAAALGQTNVASQTWSPQIFRDTTTNLFAMLPSVSSGSGTWFDAPNPTENFIWGNNILWGEDPAGFANTVWESSVLWSDTEGVWSNNVLWGEVGLPED